MKSDAIQEVITELQPLAGGRIQKIDRVGEREIVLSIRVPGRTLLLLVSADAQRIHLVSEKPARTVAGGQVQRSLREKLEGRPLVGLSADGRVVRIDAGDAGLEIDLGAKKPFRFLPPSGAGLPEAGTPVPERFPISEKLDAELKRVGPKEAENRLKSNLLKGLTAKARKLDRLRQNLEGDLSKLKRMQEEARFGELLKSMLHRVPKGAQEIEATDWTTGEPIKVRLDPALSAKANMERYFAKAKKAARGAPIVERRLAEVKAKLEEIERERSRIEAASGDALQQIASRADVGSGSIEAAREKEEKKKPIDRWSRKFVAVNGAEIRVGRGAAENDRLSLNGARGHDLWLHARGTAGAHVVLRVEKGQTPDAEAVLDAAHLAAFYSSAKNDTKVEIITTEAKNVRKTKGDPPGRVNVAKGKTILIEIDPKRLDRLLGRERS